MIKDRGKLRVILRMYLLLSVGLVCVAFGLFSGRVGMTDGAMLVFGCLIIIANASCAMYLLDYCIEYNIPPVCISILGGMFGCFLKLITQQGL